MRPLIIGIAGGSGSGKTTIAQEVRATLAREARGDRSPREDEAPDNHLGHHPDDHPDDHPDQDQAPDSTRPKALYEESPSVTIIEHDAYYRDRKDLSFAERSLLNFDHPDSLETSLLVDHIRELREGRSIDVPIYDFKHHRRADEVRRVPPVPVVIVEGILVFVESALRDELDVKIYVDTDADIRAFRRIRRDIEQRGRTFESVREQYYRTVRPMHLRFVEPSKRYADLILPEGGDNRVGVELLSALVERVHANAKGAVR